MSALSRTLHVGRRAELLRDGYTRGQIDTMIRSGDLVRLGREWLGTARTPPRVAASLRGGARLTCIDAVALHGAWKVPSAARHEARLHRSSAAAAGGLVIDHRPLRSWPDAEPIMPLTIALSHLVRCQETDIAVMVLESVAHRGLLERAALDGFLSSLPLKTRRALGPIDGRAMSGPESRVRRFLERLGVTVVPQWHVPGVGYTDMRVGECLIIECDSWTHHGSREAQNEDRRRDRALVLLGYRVVRLSFEDVVVHWERTQLFLRDLVASRLHRASPGRRGLLLCPPREGAPGGQRGPRRVDPAQR